MKLIDLTGRTFGRLTVLYRGRTTTYRMPDGKVRATMVHWVCLCDCGNVSEHTGQNMKAGIASSCGCLKLERLIDSFRGKRKDLTGFRCGKLTVIGPAVTGHDSKARWLCVCDCGNQIVTGGYQLRVGTAGKWGCQASKCRSRPEAALRIVLNQYRRSATANQLPFSISEDRFFELIKLPCHYCGTEPYRIKYSARRHFHCYYNGLDRVDSSRGYVDDNVVPCCRDCNRGKMERSVDDFIAWVFKVNAHQMSKSELSKTKKAKAKA